MLENVKNKELLSYFEPKLLSEEKNWICNMCYTYIDIVESLDSTLVLIELKSALD